jgi:hypothetical protein
MEVCPEHERIILENTAARRDGALKIRERGESSDDRPHAPWLVFSAPGAWA